MIDSENNLKLDFNERCDGSPDWVTNQLQQLTKAELWKYPNKDQLQQSIADFYQVNIDNVLASNGADEAIQLVLLACKFNYLKIRKILLPTPTFSMYEKGLEQWQLDYSLISPNSDLTQDQQQIKQQFQQNNQTMLILVRPNNPTGEMLAMDFIVELEAIAVKNNNLLLLDEAYSDFAEDNSEQLIPQSNNIIILKTLSKAYGLAALRVGYILSSKNIISAIKSITMPFNLSSLSLQLANECFTETAQEEVDIYRQSIIQNRKLMVNFLKQRGYSVAATSANFIFLTLPQKKCQLLKNLCQKNNIAIRSFDETSLENSVRITIPLQLEPLKKLFGQLQPPQLFCLDMDGTLIDVSTSYDKAIIETVRYFSDKKTNADAINQLRKAGGYNNDWLLTQALLNQLEVKIDIDQVTEKFQEFYLGTEKCRGFIENEQSLMSSETQSFFQQKNIAIVTGRPRTEAEMGARKLNLDCPIISMDDVNNCKPDPEGIIKAMQFTNPKTAWMIGDNIDDIRAAVAAGILAIAICSENQKVFYTAGAAVVLENINQIQQLT